jgi:hypothetical protein
MAKKALAVIVALAMLPAMAPMWAPEAFAESGGDVIDMSDGSTMSGTGWTYANDVYTIQDGADVIVIGDNNSPTTNQRRLQVATGAAVSITLDGVTIGGINCDDTPTLKDDNSPLKLNSGAEVNLIIEGTNSLAAGENQAGINAPYDTILSISGGGVLTATGGLSGAGIGGGYGESGGEIIISGGTITATSISAGAGIGGGGGGDGGTITISGGKITATGGNAEFEVDGTKLGGAGIGSGATFSEQFTVTGGDIVICGEAVVKAKGGGDADPIGVGTDFSGETMDPGNQFIAASVNEIPQYYIIGNPTLPADITANIPAGQTMTVPEGSTLTVNGALDVYGTLNNEGTLHNNGSITIEKGGKFTGNEPAGNPITKITDPPVAPVTPSANATTAITVDKNVTAIRTPLKTIHMKRGTTLTPPVCADSKDPVTKKPHITAKLTWSSSNPEIATVNAATGKIKAKKAGKAKITAKALNGEKLTITVNVTKKAIPLKTLTLKKAPTSLKAGKARLLSVKTTPYQATNLKVTFSSSNKKILSVDKAGKITAKKKGTAKITIKAGNKKYATTITVK